MRSVGGTGRGRPHEPPEGRGTTRPTTDRTREQIASMILSARGLDLSADSVLDAFDGSGAMGLELLSRGAAQATVVDRDRRAAARVRRSAEALGAARGEFCTLGGDVFAIVGRGLAGAPFDVVFLDPPYAISAERVSELVTELVSSGQVAPGAVIVYEHAAEAGGLACEGLSLAKSKRHGITAVDLYVAGSEEDSQ